MESPFDPEDRVVLVPAIHTDFCVIHVQKAAANGIVRIEEQALRREPERNLIPYFAV